MLTNETIAPSSEDARIAEHSSRILAPLSAQGPNHRVTVRIADAEGRSELGGEAITLPHAVLKLLVQALSEMAKGNAVELTAIHAQLTTQEAADLLGVSRPFIVKQIEEGKIPCHMVGTHRRILLTDLMAYKRQCFEEHNRALDELVQQAQELNLGY